MTSQPPDIQTLVRVQRRYTAPRDRVFRAWTEPSALERWFRPFGMPMTVAHLDLKVGGRYQFNIHEPTGKTITIRGHYVEIVPPEKLVYTWISEATEALETLVTLHFAEQGAQTELTLIHERFARVEFVRPHQEGWNSMLSVLETIFSN